MMNSHLIPPGDYLWFLSLLAHTLTLKRKGGHALSIASLHCSEQSYCCVLLLFFPSPIAFISLFFSSFPDFHGIEQDLIKVQCVCHTDLYLALKEIPPSPQFHKPDKGQEPHMLLNHWAQIWCCINWVKWIVMVEMICLSAFIAAI